jgi:hypothetical protein
MVPVSKAKRWKVILPPGCFGARAGFGNSSGGCEAWKLPNIFQLLAEYAREAVCSAWMLVLRTESGVSGCGADVMKPYLLRSTTCRERTLRGLRKYGERAVSDRGGVVGRYMGIQGLTGTLVYTITFTVLEEKRLRRG